MKTKHYEPVDHVLKSVRDSDCRRYQETIERRKTMFRQARGVASALHTITDRQPAGGLTRADGHILSMMVLQNLRACVRGERHYRPTRKVLARRSGYSERTVSAALTRLKSAGIVVAARYAKGGRLGDKGRGLATEWRSGCLQFLADQLAALGYRLPKSLRADLADLGRWAAEQVGETTSMSSDAGRGEPTGKLLPGTLYPTDTQAPKIQKLAPAERPERAAVPVSPKPTMPTRAEPPGQAESRMARTARAASAPRHPPSRADTPDRSAAYERAHSSFCAITPVKLPRCWGRNAPEKAIGKDSLASLFGAWY